MKLTLSLEMPTPNPTCRVTLDAKVDYALECIASDFYKEDAYAFVARLFKVLRKSGKRKDLIPRLLPAMRDIAPTHNAYLTPEDLEVINA